MGVPAVSLSGETTVSRAGFSILHAAGLGELTARTPDEFVRIASSLAADMETLNHLRGGMRDRLRCSALLDGRRFAGALEAAYRAMIEPCVTLF